MYTINGGKQFVCTTSANYATKYAAKFAETEKESISIYDESTKRHLMFWESQAVKDRRNCWRKEFNLPLVDNSDIIIAPRL